MEILESFLDINWKWRYPVMAKFQFHLIARLDDTCHVKRDTLMPFFQFPFALMVRLRWSKNVQEERDAPDQIMLGGRDARYCILLAVVSFLEESISFGDGCLGEYLFGAPDQNPKSLNTVCYDALKRHVLENDEFVRVIST
eukprot:11465294-Ditylum_brightwellii.AAC.1